MIGLAGAGLPALLRAVARAFRRGRGGALLALVPGIAAPVAGAGGAHLQSAAVARLPASPPISGPFWTVVVPAALLLIAVFATAALYLHFSRRGR